MMKFIPISVFSVILSIVTLALADWPEFHGPNGSGIAPDAQPPIIWSATRNITWSTPIPGSGWSSPVISHGKIYLTAATVTGDTLQALRVLCVDMTTGAIDWDQPVFGPSDKAVKHTKNSHASSSVIVADNRIYAHFGYLGTACLDPAGAILWTSDQLYYDPMHGNGGSPVIFDDKLIFHCDAKTDPYIAALDTHTGNVAWRTPRGPVKARNKFSFCTPILVPVAGQTQLISPASGAVFACDPATGRELWRFDYGNGYSVTPRPVTGHGLVFVSSGFGDDTIYAIRPGGSGNVTSSHLAWKNKGDAPNTPSLLLVGDELYYVADTGKMSCVDARTGKPHWQQRVAGKYSSSPVCADGRIYITNESGLTSVLKAGPAFQLLAENDLAETTYATPALAANALFIRTESKLYRIENK